MTIKMSVEEAARLLEVTPQYIRIGLRKNRFPFGSAVQMSENRWRYHIVKSKVLEYAGLNQGGD